MTGQSPRSRRHSPAVYRRRRLALILGIVLIAALVWLLIAQPWRGAADAEPVANPSSSPSATTPAPTPTATEPTETGNPGDALPEETADAPLEAVACATGAVSVEPLTDKESYAAGESPQISIRLTNTSASPCTINVGTTQQVYTVTSGGDTWWRSTDCQSEPSDMVVTLDAGQVVESATPVTWDRTRSSVDTCDGDRPQAPGSGASYHVQVSIGGITAASTKQIFLY